ncbi:uncharacterized protein A1O5_04881 [Cladophialophora psammophila CBS 110553]|uniref:Heterokaryon incompatibility domain-containing protein n=1 Tax=Cladophialophora psammophila CBS 110553 TaxID=1182543 RepID=W9WW19_9EURO|nr:uncharacterized protein A1O5_04881 [Cladophialophora psammophila CBS 110553]EXJ72377.1 hypothetical protein A1O5_04881 [Cladophialophora psammophila CBS 110553]
MSTPASELMDADSSERAAQTTQKSPTQFVEDDKVRHDAKSESSQVLYEPLSEDRLEIRIIDLEPSTDYHSEIHCRLRKFSLLEVKYGNPSLFCLEALSYTWGNDAALTNVVVNGQRTRTTRNLEAFLRHRRETHEKVILWVDAICINQNDPQDKNSQIPKMNMIYGFASKLTIWLGPDSDDSSLAMETLVKLGCGAPYDKMPLLERNKVTALQKLLTRPWWTRT